MSHFVVMVLVPADEAEADLHGTVEHLLDPYSEHIEVTPYEQPCFCVGRAAQRRANDAASAEFGTIADLRQSFACRGDVTDLKAVKQVTKERAALQQIEADLDGWWKEHLQPWEDLHKATLEADQERDQPNPECDECNGTGKATTQYNPDSKWDWWQIGGRWSGWLEPDYDPRTDPANIMKCDLCEGTGHRDDAVGRAAREKDPDFTCNACQGYGQRVKWPTQWENCPGNIVPVARWRELLMKPTGEPGDTMVVNATYLPYSVLTPDGAWHEKGQMGWWGLTTGDMPEEDWMERVLDLATKHADKCVAVVVDCHT